MTISLATPVMSAGIGKPASVVAYAQRNGAMRLGEVKTYVDTIYDLAPKVGLNPDILIAQSDEETDHWRSDWWVDRLNPAGIGITGDPAQNAASGEWNSGADAAKAQIIHMLAYTRGSIPAIAEPWLKFDPRYQAVFQAHLDNTVSLVDDLGGGTWAADPRYAEKIVQHHEAIFTGEPPMAETITFGRVPRPGNIIDKFVEKPEGHGWDNQGPRDKLLAVVVHAVKGYAWTTGNYFSNPNEPHGYNALTDWGICGAIDANVFGADKDGLIMDWNDPDNRGYYRRPWASGGDGSVTINGDAVVWVNRYGIAAINTYGEAVELSLLNNNDPVSAKMLQSAINLIAWRVDKKGKIAYNVWPKNNDGLHMILSHYELGKSSCHIPDSVFEAIINGVRDRLKQFQVSTTTTTTPAPKPPSIYPKGMTLQLAKRLYGSLKVSWAAKPFTFDPSRSECKDWLERGKASMTGDTYDTGTWPSIADAIRRGDGSRVYTYSDGSTYEQ